MKKIAQGSWFLFFMFAIGCASREDAHFPEFPANPPVVVSANESVLVQEAYQPREICRVDSFDRANDIYEYLKNNYSDAWERTNFRLYVPSYYINFGGVKIEVLKGGGLAINAPRPDDWLSDTGKVQFVRHSTRRETFDLLKKICAKSELAGLHESPAAVQIAIRNTSGQLISDITVSGGGQTKSIESIEPMQTTTAILITKVDSDLQLSFANTSKNRVSCLMRTFLTPSMNGKIDIDVAENMECEIRYDSTSLF